MKTEQKQQKDDVVSSFPCNANDERINETIILSIFQNKVTIVFIATLITLIVIFFGVALCYTFSQKPQPIKIECSIQSDSLGHVSAESKVYCDSLVQVIKRHEQNIDDRYEFFLQQRENYQEYLTIGGFVLTVIVSFVGFMGYKSLTTIEDRMKIQLESLVETKVLKETLNSVTRYFDEYKKNTDKRIDKHINQSEKLFISKGNEMSAQNGEKIEHKIAEVERSLRNRIFTYIHNNLKKNPTEDIESEDASSNNVDKRQTPAPLPEKFTRDSNDTKNPFDNNKE